jgi:hypothetical protein
LPICLYKADLVPMGQIDVGRILPQENHARAMSLFPALVQVRLHQGRTRDIGLDLRNRYKALASFQVCI